MIKLKGILVGNGVTDRVTYDKNSGWATGFWHNVIDLKLENSLRENHCFPNELSIYLEPTKEPSTKCNDIFLEFEAKMASINPYDYYRKCWHDDD